MGFNEVKPGKRQPLQEVYYLLKELGKGILSIRRMQRPISLLSFPRVCAPAYIRLNLGDAGKHGAWTLKSQLICTSASMVECDRGTVARFLTILFNLGRFILLGWSERRVSSGKDGQCMPKTTWEPGIKDIVAQIGKNGYTSISSLLFVSTCYYEIRRWRTPRQVWLLHWLLSPGNWRHLVIPSGWNLCHALLKTLV